MDLCGGAGPKAFYLAAKGAEAVSYDLNPKRQEAGRRRAVKPGLRVAYCTQDLREPLPERAKKVLLDAPCTGTGTFRSHPELRYRLAPEDPRRMAELQLMLLETAAQATEEGVAGAFLADHPEFAPEPTLCPLPVLKAGLGVYVAPEGGLDGFYYLRLRKVNSRA